MPQLNPEFFASQIFWLLIVFALIYVLIAKYFLPRVGSVVELRSSQIEEDIATSEKIIEDYKAVELNASKILENAKHESFSIVDKATKKAEAQILDKVSIIERDIGKNTAKKEESLARMKTQMHGDIEKIAIEVGQHITAQLMDQLEFKGSKDVNRS